MGTAPATASEATHDVDILHYAVNLTPDMDSGEVSGQVTITLQGHDPSTELRFDAGDLQVVEVLADGQPLAYAKTERSLRITLPRPLRAGEKRSISITYRGKPRNGMQFHPERGEIYTIFSTSQWMPCVDSPAERATLDLTVRLPAGMTAVGTGRELRSRDATLHRWRLDTPMPSYLYGFAAGRYQQVSLRANGYSLRYLSTDRSSRELQRLFSDTADMLQFFTERAGLRMQRRYTQVLVTSTIGQELAGLSLLSEAQGQRTLNDPTDVVLMAHEAAHQWWGNLLTCRDWRHFWLNEGFATFMAAAYLEHRQGAAAYARQVDGWRQRVDQLRADGRDRPLVFPDWNSPTSDDRAVVYQRGAYVLHLLRRELGEQVFWRGIRLYTTRHAGQSVVTEDFRSAMEEASGRPLTGFFAQWISN